MQVKDDRGLQYWIDLLAFKQKRFHELKNGSGFAFGHGKIAHAEAQRWRREINELKKKCEEAKKLCTTA